MFDCDFAYAYTGPLGTADYRCHWDDFVVDEVLGFTPEAEGEHDYLQLKKRGVNTEWLAKQLAQFAGIRSMDVGYAGMKDRHASTTQWFSLYRPKGQPLPWADFLAQLDDDVSLVSISRGTKKLRPGSHQGNRFAIRLRHLQTPHAELDARLEQIAQQGFPNYFGEQRFGINGQNLEAAAAWLDKGRPGGNQGKGLWLSALRSYLFNRVLSCRLSSSPWQELTALTGPLWGRGRLPADTAAFEQACFGESWAQRLEALEHAGLNQERRALWLVPEGMRWQWEPQALLLEFALPAGAFATSLMRELVTLSDRSIKQHNPPSAQV